MIYLKVGKGGNEEMVDELPNLKTGEFQLVSPDFSDKPTSVKLRWLYTDHGSALGEDEVEQLTPKSLRGWADNLSKTPIQTKLPPAIPLTRKQRLEGIDEHQQPFESDLMGGLMLLKDSKDPLSVMLGITNLLTSITLFLSTLILADAWLDGESSSIIVTLGILICLISCVAVIIETFLADDIVLVKKIRRRSRPLQYFILVWIWFLWFWLQKRIIRPWSGWITSQCNSNCNYNVRNLGISSSIKIGKTQHPVRLEPC